MRLLALVALAKQKLRHLHDHRKAAIALSTSSRGDL
jgi:hypothetical protein